MKRFMMLIALVAIIFVPMNVVAQQACTTIQSGTLLGSDGAVLDTGFDKWGYNYQAHVFNGKYCDAYKNAAWCQPYANDDLLMQWNDAWMSNQDCDGDRQLDRHLGYPTYRGSGAWLTNHQKGVYVDANGKKQRWNYFVKIVAAPADAVLTNGTWYIYDAQAKEMVAIGYAIWNDFAVVLETYNDTGTGDHGILYHGARSSGFGFYGPHP